MIVVWDTCQGVVLHSKSVNVRSILRKTKRTNRPHSTVENDVQQVEYLYFFLFLDLFLLICSFDLLTRFSIFRFVRDKIIILLDCVIVIQCLFVLCQVWETWIIFLLWLLCCCVLLLLLLICCDMMILWILFSVRTRIGNNLWTNSFDKTTCEVFRSCLERTTTHSHQHQFKSISIFFSSFSFSSLLTYQISNKNVENLLWTNWKKNRNPHTMIGCLNWIFIVCLFSIIIIIIIHCLIGNIEWNE